MITSAPIGDWTWEVTMGGRALRPVHAAKYALAVWDVLAVHQLADPVGRVSLSVRAAGDVRDVRVRADGLRLEPEPLSSATALGQALAEADSLDGDFVVEVRIDCPGYWLESGVKHRAEKLFVIQVDIWKGSLLTVTLETYSDAWLTMDTRDREQLGVYTENAPRLAAALAGIAKVLGTDQTPGDPNRYATPTATGFEDPRAEGPAYDDSWGTFEVADRSERLRSKIPASENEYEEITDHPVRYFTVRRGEQTMGYVWASVGEEAAGYEPRTAAGEEAFDVGAAWLLRLRDAHGRGLSALAALSWVAQNPLQPEMGQIVEGVPQEVDSLDVLEERSARY
ncbi:hypothetical protein ACFV6E_14385 [Streptomyces sp. NPDC059785]|uniref:hypothetical protein n=1 Tax=Streptomyces sp. NPDC059785 TaxID=3346945 RepID=UPI00364795F1